MKILSKRKDYYDYLVGKYGIDEMIVYDRRDCTVLAHDEYNIAFSKKKLYNDKPKREVMSYHNGKYISEMVGLRSELFITYGKKTRKFLVERYLDALGNVRISHKEVPLEGLDFRRCSNDREKRDAPIFIKIAFIESYIDNPILDGTWLPCYISPEEIYTEVYNYLLMKSAKKIEDNRSDVEKMESKGFDKVSSFRNPVYHANSKKNKKKVV